MEANVIVRAAKNQKQQRRPNVRAQAVVLVVVAIIIWDL